MQQEPILAVVQKSDHSLGYYRIADGVELSRVQTGTYPHEFTSSPDGRFFYISEYGVQSSSSQEEGGSQVAVLDVAAREVVGRISCGAFRRPHGIVCDHAGTLYVLCEGSNRLLVMQSPRAGAAFSQSYPTGGDKGHMLAVTRDGARAFVMNINSETVTTIDLRAGADSTPQIVCKGRWPEGFCFNRDESLLYVANRGADDITVVDTVRLEQVGTLRARQTPLRMVMDSQGRIICVHFGEDKTISVINPDTGTEDASFVPPAASVFAGLDDSGSRAAFSLQDDTVQIYNTRSWECEATIRTRTEPDVVAFLQQ